MLLLMLEGGASLLGAWSQTNVRPPSRETKHSEYDAELGWVHLQNVSVPDLYGPDLHLTTNGQRLRGPRDYSLEKPEGKYRIICLGDSFTMGYGVGDKDTFPALLEQLEPRIETINMGMGGYGIDQCYLWYLREGVAFEADLLLFSFIEGDFNRMLPKGNVANRVKPLLELVEDKPVAVNLPIPNILEPSLGRRWGNFWKKSSLFKLLPKPKRRPLAPPAEQPYAPVSLRIFEELRDLSLKRDQAFVLAYLPVESELRKTKSPLVDGWLRPELEPRKVELLDLRESFRRLKRSERAEYFTQAHFSRKGNMLAAREFLARLRELDPRFPR